MNDVQPVLRYDDALPISARRREIVEAIRAHQVVVLAGETGSGKTTQLPKMCLEALGPKVKGKIGCTQPRRVAAMSVSQRVAEEMQVGWGGFVGCKMRFNDTTGRYTRVKFMTDGILLAEIQGDPKLRGYSALIIDEAHERSLNIDFLLGYLKQLLQRRPDLKLLITSATIDTEAFSKHFGGAPIIEVSGRTYPVEIRYRSELLEGDDQNYVEASAAAVEEVLAESADGDVLVFMPTERDIRESVDLIEGRLGGRVEVLSLFGRLAAADQQRVFSPGAKRRVIVSTNVAETSVTLPRIGYVIDSGLVRMSRYNPRTRTQRLPVEPISQSSANQRAGRAGRIREGVCVRLYPGEGFEQRDAFTTPEIQRSNLAEVILRMKAFRLGDIESFPFIEPPQGASIRSGYKLLHELGALEEDHELTGLGRDLARLPLDPSLGRMLLQAQREDCLEDLLVLAAGLTIPDPRERPEEKRELANAAHKAFATVDSDFMSLLKIWEAAPDASKGAKGPLRRFCKQNFLSFARMREWRDLWRQLRSLKLDQGAKGTASDPKAASREDAIHRCILAAQLGHLARRENTNVYKAAGGREVKVFPGSHLFQRREKKTAKGEDRSRQPKWIVAGEIVQTSQLFARMLGRIEPGWAVELGAHLCQYQYSDPHWSAKAGRVLVTQQIRIHGLEVERRKIDYGKIDAEGATRLFIRAVLLDIEAPVHHAFHAQNHRLREKIETTMTRVRQRGGYDGEEALFEFYDTRIAEVSSIHDLNRLIQEHGMEFLIAEEADLVDDEEVGEELLQFPDEVELGNTVLPLSYRYQPGGDADGVTVEVPLATAEHLTSGQLQWMVPGLREELCRTLMRALPRALRRQLMPIEAKAEAMATRFDPGDGDFLPAFAADLKRHYGVVVSTEDWPEGSIPDHLRPRLRITGGTEELVTRDLSEVRQQARKRQVRSGAWDKLAARFEQYGLSDWTIGDLPLSIVVEEVAGVPVLAFPGLSCRENEVDLRLFRTAESASKETPMALRRLAEFRLGKDLAWLDKELRQADRRPKAKTRPKAVSLAEGLGSLELPSAAAAAEPMPSVPLAEQARDHVLAHLLRLEPLMPLTEPRFNEMCEKAHRELPLITHQALETRERLLRQRDEILAKVTPYPGMEEDLARLMPPDLLQVTPHGRLKDLSRYLKAVQVRAERAVLQPAKDEDKAGLIADFEGWEQEVPADRFEIFRWMLEEYRVSVFAQELGTAQPVSPKRLEKVLAGGQP